VTCTEPAAPELTVELEDMIVVEEDRVELTCKIYLGNPTSTVTWFSDNTELMNECEKYDIRPPDGATQTLIIVRSQRSDSAIYRCEAVNKHGKVVTQCRLNVICTSSSMSLCLSCLCVVYLLYIINKRFISNK